MSDTPATPEAASEASVPPAAPTTEAPAAAATDAAEAPAEGLGAALKEQDLSIRALLEAGVHYGHQPGRWNP
jgi:hypothetical protein